MSKLQENRCRNKVGRRQDFDFLSCSAECMPERNDERPEARPWFTTTHWSVVLQAAVEDPTRAEDALGQLCRVYWAPVTPTSADGSSVRPMQTTSRSNSLRGF